MTPKIDDPSSLGSYNAPTEISRLGMSGQFDESPYLLLEISGYATAGRIALLKRSLETYTKRDISRLDLVAALRNPTLVSIEGPRRGGMDDRVIVEGEDLDGRRLRIVILIPVIDRVAVVTAWVQQPSLGGNDEGGAG